MKQTFHQPVPELPCRDVKKAQQFYADQLGFTIAWTYPEIGGISKNNAVIFLRRHEQIVPTTVWVFADDVDVMYSELVNTGVSICEEISTKPWGIRQFTIEDPDGNRFIFHHDV